MVGGVQKKPTVPELRTLPCSQSLFVFPQVGNEKIRVANHFDLSLLPSVLRQVGLIFIREFVKCVGV